MQQRRRQDAGGLQDPGSVFGAVLFRPGADGRLDLGGVLLPARDINPGSAAQSGRPSKPASAANAGPSGTANATHWSSPAEG